jgi:protein-S-isoprenylcysteine O-methyltransferase Ste14
MPSRIASTSIALVVAQFAALAALVVPWRAPAWHALGAAPIVLGAALAAWTLVHNRPGNFGVLPEPRESSRLVTTGPYARVRHPMYLAVLLFGAGCVLGWRGVPHVLAWVALGIVLHLKALREERLLEQRFPEYRAYRARTRRLLPFVV